MRDVLLPAVGINLDSGNDVMAHLDGFSTFANTQQKSFLISAYGQILTHLLLTQLSLLDDGLEYLFKLTLVIFHLVCFGRVAGHGIIVG